MLGWGLSTDNCNGLPMKLLVIWKRLYVPSVVNGCVGKGWKRLMPQPFKVSDPTEIRSLKLPPIRKFAADPAASDREPIVSVPNPPSPGLSVVPLTVETFPATIPTPLRVALPLRLTGPSPVLEPVEQFATR